MIEITSRKFAEILKKENINPDELQKLVVEKLAGLHKTVATAESCTGGLLSKRLTEVSGASEVFECGVCSYANRIKHKVLGVSEQTLATVGAVSPETAEQMAQGIMTLAQSDFGVSTTGIAGPTGGTKDKPVGLVYIALCDRAETVVVRAMLGDAENADRETIRKLSSDVAFYFLLSKMYK